MRGKNRRSLNGFARPSVMHLQLRNGNIACGDNDAPKATTAVAHTNCPKCKQYVEKVLDQVFTELA